VLRALEDADRLEVALQAEKRDRGMVEAAAAKEAEADKKRHERELEDQAKRHAADFEGCLARHHEELTRSTRTALLLGLMQFPSLRRQLSRPEDGVHVTRENCLLVGFPDYFNTPLGVGNTIATRGTAGRTPFAQGQSLAVLDVDTFCFGRVQDEAAQMLALEVGLVKDHAAEERGALQAEWEEAAERERAKAVQAKEQELRWRPQRSRCQS